MAEGVKMWCLRAPCGGLCCLSLTENGAWKDSVDEHRLADAEEQIERLRRDGFKAIRVTVTLEDATEQGDSQ